MLLDDPSGSLASSFAMSVMQERRKEMRDRRVVSIRAVGATLPEERPPRLELLLPLDGRSGPAFRRSRSSSMAMTRAVVDAALAPWLLTNSPPSPPTTTTGPSEPRGAGSTLMLIAISLTLFTMGALVATALLASRAAWCSAPGWLCL
jgi:hypothetical protein